MIDRARFEQLRLQGSLLLITFCGLPCILDARSVLFLPSYDALVFSDLHFEKASFLAQFANPIPQLDTITTLQRMQAIITDYQPAKVICLGDSLHDAGALNRMSSEVLKQLQQLVAQPSKWYWVIGNHDPVIPTSLSGVSVPYLLLDGVCFSHEPTAIECNGQVIGHYHPKTRRRLGGKRMTGKCFISDQSTLIMPAFGAYTGGLLTTDSAISRLFATAKTEYLLVQNRIYQV